MECFKKQLVAVLFFFAAGSIVTLSAMERSAACKEKKGVEQVLESIIEAAVEKAQNRKKNCKATGENAEEIKIPEASVLLIAKLIAKLSWQEIKTLAYLVKQIAVKKNERLENIWKLLVEAGKISYIPLSPYLLNVLPYSPYALTISPHVFTILCLLGMLPPLDCAVTVLSPPIKYFAKAAVQIYGVTKSLFNKCKSLAQKCHKKKKNEEPLKPENSKIVVYTGRLA